MIFCQHIETKPYHQTYRAVPLQAAKRAVHYHQENRCLDREIILNFGQFQLAAKRHTKIAALVYEHNQ